MDNNLSLSARIRISSFLVTLLFGASMARSDETCNSPYISNLIKGQEDFIQVWTLGESGLGDGSDKLVTVDVNPASKSYGKVIATVSVGGRGEAHHMGFTDDRKYLWAGDLDDSKIYVFDVGSNSEQAATRSDDHGPLGKNRVCRAAYVLCATRATAHRNLIQ